MRSVPERPKGVGLTSPGLLGRGLAIRSGFDPRTKFGVASAYEVGADRIHFVGFDTRATDLMHVEAHTVF